MPKASSLSEDTLLRMLVTATSELIARIAMLRTAGQFQQTQAEIDQSLEELLGLKADLARRLPDEQIIEMVTLNGVLDVARLYGVAVMFREQGRLLTVEGDAIAGQNSQARALHFFTEVAFAVENEFPEADEQIDALFESLGTSIPEDTLFSLFDYYEQCGDYAQAEKALDQMVTVTHHDPDILAERRAFYQRLLAESDQELTDGGISRAMVEHKIAGFS